jgi:hypothetical protein
MLLLYYLPFLMNHPYNLSCCPFVIAAHALLDCVIRNNI